MEHCLYPADPLYPPIKVPYLEHPPFDGGEFSTFPARNGWDKREFLTGQLKSGSPEKAAAFLQTWLFFGLASTVLNPSVIGDAKEFFLRPSPENPGQWVVSTDKLRGAMDKWMKEMLDDEDEAKRVMENAVTCLDEASLLSQAMETGYGPGFRLDEAYPEVRLSIMMMGDQLWSLLRALEWEQVDGVHRAAKAVTNIVGKKSYLGKMVGKLEQSATSVLQSKHKGALFQAADLSKFGRDQKATAPVAADPSHAANAQGPSSEWGKFLLSSMLRGRERTKMPVSGPSWGTSGLLRSRMRQAEWCPYQAERVQDIMSPWAVHFASALRWTDSIHTDHHACDLSRCVGHNINEDTYKARHVSDDCDCEFIGLPVDSLQQTVRDGKIPVAETTLDLATGDISMVPSDNSASKIGYTALSHVWSHGLGNARENKLPKCQLRRLLQTIRDRDTFVEYKGFGLMNSATLFQDKVMARLWIDTLCVPFDKECRRAAIAKMTEVYAKCIHLYVMDLDLYSIKLSEISQTEACIRLLCSTWMQRMWTFQEGASKLTTAIVFNDKNLTWANIVHEYFTRPEQPIARRGKYFDILGQMLHASYGNDTFPGGRGPDPKSEEGDCIRLTRYWNGLAWRTSSKASDQPLIISAMDFGRFASKMRGIKMKDQEEFGAKFRRVQAASSAERWLAYYKERAVYPQGILFVNCDTLDTAGYRWAPIEVGTDHRTIVDPKVAKITPTGLVVKLLGYTFPSLKTPPAPRFEFIDTAKFAMYSVKPMRDDPKYSDWVPPARPGVPHSYAIILGSHQAGYCDFPGLLVTMESKSDDSALKVRFGRRVWVARSFKEREDEFDAWMSNPDSSTWQGSVVRAQRHEDDQAWCVG